MSAHSFAIWPCVMNAYAVQQKRAMGIALAAVTVHAMTPTHAHWGNQHYPPIAERLTAMISGHNLSAHRADQDERYRYDGLRSGYKHIWSEDGRRSSENDV